MDKISSILPASPRITNVDMKSSGTARSGMPSYGRPQLEATGSARRHTQTNQMHAAMNKIVDPHVDIVEKISNEFFMQKSQAPKSELIIDRAAIFDADSDLDPMTESDYQMAEQELAPVMSNEQTSDDADLDVPIAGGYLDVAV